MGRQEFTRLKRILLETAPKPLAVDLGSLPGWGKWASARCLVPPSRRITRDIDAVAAVCAGLCLVASSLVAEGIPHFF